MTYSEYLSFLKIDAPNSISEYDVALSKILPFLNDFAFVNDGTFIAMGRLGRPLTIASFTLPAGSKVGLCSWNAVRAFAPADFESNGFAIHGDGKDSVVQLDCDWGQGALYVSGFRLAKDTVVGGIPCKAESTESWDINIALHPDGTVQKAILADNAVIDGVNLIAGERFQRNWQGKLEAAVLLRTRVIQGRAVIAYDTGSYPFSRGFWGGPTPNIFFENGVITACHESDKTVNGAAFPGVNRYFYDAKGTVTGISPQTLYFLGYPVFAAPRQSWDWSMPTPSVSIADGQASCTIDAKTKITGKSGSFALPEGAQVIVDMKTGACVSARYPEGNAVAYDPVKDEMKPRLFPVEQQPSQSLLWIDQWLSAHKDDSDLRKAHAQVREQLLALEKKAAQEALYAKIFDLTILFKDKTAGLTPGNIAFDRNADGKIQDAEVIPNAILDSLSTAFLPESIVAYVVRNGLELLPRDRLQAMGDAMGTLPAFDPRKDSLGVFDLLGSALSKRGIHPFSTRRIYYFPNGSGDKVICDSISFYKSTGSPMALTIDVFTPTTAAIDSIHISLPGVEGKVRAVLYANEKVQESVTHRQKGDSKEYWLSKGKDPDYWSNLNMFTFHESGALASYRGIPFFDSFPSMPLPPDVAWRKGPDGYPPIPNVAEWAPDGRLLAMSEPNGFFDLPGGITVHSPRWIRWLENAPQGKIYVQCDMGRPVSVTIKKGKYTLYRFNEGKWVPYEKTFAADTTMKVQGFILGEKGAITSYW